MNVPKRQQSPTRTTSITMLRVFKDDQAVRRYCKRNYMDKPKVVEGQVSVYDEFRNQRHVVGVMG